MKAFLLFLKEKQGVMVLLLLQFLLLWIFYFIGGLKQIETLFYYCVLSLLLFVFFLGITFIKQKKLFIYLSKKDTVEKPDHLGYTVLGKVVWQKLSMNYAKSQQELIRYKNTHDDHLTFIDKWVHYIKTPLAVIRVITQEHDEYEEAQQIQDESDKILHGVNMALYFARTTNFTSDFKFERFQLHCLATDTINELKHYLIKRQIYPELDIASDCFVYSDKKWLAFILYQLCNNAIRYSNPGGKLFIYTQFFEGRFWLCVKDIGVGIPLQEQERVFDQFYTGTNGRKYGESTGIGLYLVKKICNKMGYPIHLKSQVNEGSIFSIGLVERSSRVTI